MSMLSPTAPVCPNCGNCDADKIELQIIPGRAPPRPIPAFLNGARCLNCGYLEADTQKEENTLLCAALRLYVHHCNEACQRSHSDELRQIWQDERDAAERIIARYL